MNTTRLKEVPDMKQNLHLEWVHVDDSNGRPRLEAHWVPEGMAAAPLTTHAA